MNKVLIWMFLTIIVGSLSGILFGVGPKISVVAMFGFGGLWLIYEKWEIGNILMVLVVTSLYFDSWIVGTVMLLLWFAVGFYRVGRLYLILKKRRKIRNKYNRNNNQASVEMDRHIKRTKIKLILVFLGWFICGGLSVYFLEEIPFALLRTIVGLLLGAIPTIFIYTFILDLKLYKRMKRDWVDLYETQRKSLEDIQNK